ncbi:hypothetical protein V7128_05930 [Neobacillus vireti]|uniref:hypothetical protein n=1 Tax=Neobacillus vireti TaxID=220686 RepID=UPI002FFDD36B
MSRDIPNYDTWKLDTPDNHLKFRAYCQFCSLEVWMGEPYVEDGFDTFHEECWEELELFIVTEEK